MKRTFLRLLSLILPGFTLLGFVACSDPAPPSLPPEEIIDRAAVRMAEMSGFHFIIDRSGAPAYLDPAETLVFRRAEGDYVAPDRSRAIVRIIAPGLVTDVSVISIGAIQWETNLLTGRWEELPPDWGFNPNVLFDADIGLQAILTSDMTGFSATGTERLEGGPDGLLYTIQGEVAGDKLYQMSGGLIGPGPVTASLWIAPETFELHRILATEPVPGGPEPTIWQVDFANFDQMLEIEPPAVSDVNQ